MAKIKYFSGENELFGVREQNGVLVGYASKEDLFFVDGLGWQGFTPVERKIEYKSNPSKHECDDRCRNATGLVMKCECSCGGKNHGRGASMTCESV